MKLLDKFLVAAIIIVLLVTVALLHSTMLQNAREDNSALATQLVAEEEAICATAGFADGCP